MNSATIKGLRQVAESMVTINKTAEGYEVRKAGKLLGITRTLEGAKELASL